MEAPEFLTPEEASRLTGHSTDVIDCMIDDDAVGLVGDGDGLLIERRSLCEFQESLALVLHWNRKLPWRQPELVASVPADPILSPTCP
jgi:hypothetical protein